MKTEVEVLIAEAARQFATAVARAIQQPTTSGEWVDQATCAPLAKRKFLALVASGELPARALGKQRLVRRRDLDHYIERRARPQRSTSGVRTDAEIDAAVLADLDLAPAPTKEEP